MRSAAGRCGLRRYRRGIAEERRGVAGGEMGRGGELGRAGRGCDAMRGGAGRQGAVDRGRAQRRGADRLGRDRARLGGEPLRSGNTHRHTLRGRIRRSRLRASRAAGLPARQERALYNDILNTYNPIARRCRNDMHTLCRDSTAAPRPFPLADCSPLPRMRHRSLRAQLAPI